MRLIDADALAKELMHEGLGYQYNRVINAPTIDAVPVIKCKDCKNYLTDDGIGIMCQMHYYRVKPTDFCSWAERKEE